jgi:hypothetical protein
MDVAYPAATLTTVAFSDGTASVLRSAGGGFFGGCDTGVQAARTAFLKLAQLSQPRMAIANEFPEPKTGDVAFYLRTDRGVFAASASEAQLQDPRHPLYQLFIAGLRILHEYLRLQKQTQ